DAVARELATDRGEVGIRRHLERQLGAFRLRGLDELDRELAGAGREKRAVALARDERQADDLGVMLDRLVEVRRFKAGVAEPEKLDHGGTSARLVRTYLRPTRSTSADMPT